MPTTGCDPRLDADIVAATLRALGYAARSYSAAGEDGEPPEFGVAIHIVCTEAWRYPDGRWEIIDRPARLVAAARTAPRSWLFNCGVAVPEPTSAAALAEWVAAQLPPPDLPEYRAYWQFSPPDTPPAAAPMHWARQWCEHWTRGGADITRPVTDTPCDVPGLRARHGAVP
ncbi:hypothetical protein [Mycobacterium sp.]|jgi:hypothetical protein|uniref:hypothetical protein n=1 Tax=Mycobacterium sp. TaxID=1785 RepID=UPI0025EC2C2D|nr:hypothetical protein [Mycobacterium sp.]